MTNKRIYNIPLMTKYKTKNNADRAFKFDTLTVVVTNERSSMFAKTHTAVQVGPTEMQ